MNKLIGYILMASITFMFVALLLAKLLDFMEKLLRPPMDSILLLVLGLLGLLFGGYQIRSNSKTKDE